MSYLNFPSQRGGWSGLESQGGSEFGRRLHRGDVPPMETWPADIIVTVLTVAQKRTPQRDYTHGSARSVNLNPGRKAYMIGVV